MIPIQTIIVVTAILSFFIVLFWITITIKRGGGSFYITKILSKTESSPRFNFALARNVTLAALLFALYIFLTGNFMCFILFDEWVFGIEAAKGTLVGVLVYTIFYIVEHVYNFAKDMSEKRIYIHEEKRKPNNQKK